MIYVWTVILVVSTVDLGGPARLYMETIHEQRTNASAPGEEFDQALRRCQILARQIQAKVHRSTAFCVHNAEQAKREAE